MKKAKLIPSVLMLILCVAVLAIGIYAAAPVSHSVVGTVKINAANANVKITAYLDDSDGNYSNDTAVSSTYSTRMQETIQLYEEAILFDCSNANTASQVRTQKLYFKIENLSSYALGAYFLEGTIGSSGTQSTNIATTKNFDGTYTSTSKTITNLLTADFSPYTQIAKGESARVYSMLTLNQVNPEESTVEINLNLNVEPLNEDLLPTASTTNAINLVNADNMAVKIATSVENGGETNASTTMNVSNTNWNAGAVSFDTSDDAKHASQLRLKTVKMKMLVTNTDSVPVSVAITAGSGNGTQANTVSVTIIGGSYIAPGDTEEVSVQFAAVYDRGTNGSLTAPTAPTIATYNYNVTVTKASTASTLLSRVKHNATGIANGTMNFYIEFGTNPYYSTSTASTQSEKLKWYIWAKDDGNGNPTPLVSGLDYNGSIFLGGGKYYFISEYILDVEDSNMGICYQNEYVGDYRYSNPENDKYACDYAASNYRNYLNGLTVKRAYAYDSNYNYLANGSNVNFLDRFKLTEDALYSQIMERDLQELYTKGANYDGFPSDYAGEADKFWALSYDEYLYVTDNRNDIDAAMAYTLSSGTSNSASYWRLRSPKIFDYVFCVFGNGDCNGYTKGVRDNSVGVRPAFQIQI